jgi:hypothetical protein
VEQVLDEKFIKGVRHFLIRWKGYEPESDTWEPESTLNCSELIAEFKAKQKKKGKAKLAKKRSKESSNSDDQGWDENENFEVKYSVLTLFFSYQPTSNRLNASWTFTSKETVSVNF